MSFPSIDDVRRRSAVDTQQVDAHKPGAARPDFDSIVAHLTVPTLDYAHVAHVMTASPEALRAERVGAALDKTRDASSGPYRVNGQSVIAQPQFRMSGGYESSHGTFKVDANGDFAINPQKDFAGALTTKGQQLMTILARAGVGNVGAAMLGYPTPHDLVRATQALIDAGKLPTLPAPATTADCIRQMQWDWGLGIDCVDWCMNAFHDVTGRSAESVGLKHGTDPFGQNGDKTPAGFTRAGVLQTRPGDIITLKDPSDVGHRVIVRDVHALDISDKRTLVARWGESAEKFLRGAGPFHVFKVDSSWGADIGKAFGGYRSDTWVYDEGTKLWMSYDPHASDVLVSRDGPAGENYVGSYRWSQS